MYGSDLKLDSETLVPKFYMITSSFSAKFKDFCQFGWRNDYNPK